MIEDVDWEKAKARERSKAQEARNRTRQDKFSKLGRRGAIYGKHLHKKFGTVVKGIDCEDCC